MSVNGPLVCEITTPHSFCPEKARKVSEFEVNFERQQNQKYDTQRLLFVKIVLFNIEIAHLS
jgi:hypothetical protein